MDFDRPYNFYYIIDECRRGFHELHKDVNRVSLSVTLNEVKGLVFLRFFVRLCRTQNDSMHMSSGSPCVIQVKLLFRG
jgi:hypothetical protein